jgi:hypothetical protein
MNEIQQLIRKYEGEITLLLERKNSLKANDPLYAICEVKVLEIQKFICELRGLL